MCARKRSCQEDSRQTPTDIGRQSKLMGREKENERSDPERSVFVVTYLNIMSTCFFSSRQNRGDKSKSNPNKIEGLSNCFQFKS